MKGYQFFAMHSRMKYINRWALMRNTVSENISEHSNDVAAIAHAIAVIKNVRFGGNLNADRAAVLGLYHDMPEIITGDMPTPIKYHSRALRAQMEQVEAQAGRRLISMLPDDIKDYYESLLFKQEQDEYLWKIVKAADKISALIKCIEERNAGNREFDEAMESVRAAIDAMGLEEANSFLDDFIGAFSLTLDELSE